MHDEATGKLRSGDERNADPLTIAVDDMCILGNCIKGGPILFTVQCSPLHIWIVHGLRINRQKYNEGTRPWIRQVMLRAIQGECDFLFQGCGQKDPDMPHHEIGGGG